MKSVQRPSERSLEEAAGWSARLHADDRTAKDEADFRAWLAESPEHAAAFEAMDRGLNALSRMPRRAQQPAHPVSRRQLVMAGASGCLVLGASFFALRPASAQTYQTAIGEQKHVSLREGSKLLLNANTKLIVSISDAARTAQLVYGRASFDIAADSSRPFVVSAGDRHIVSHGSRFNIGCDGNQVQVIMTHGEASIKIIGAQPTAGIALSAGDRLLSNGASVRMDRPRIAPLVAWQTGTAIFDDDLLSDAVREMNLYSQTKLEIADTKTASLHVSGIYRVGNNVAFADSVAKILPVRVKREGDRVILRSFASNG